MMTRKDFLIGAASTAATASAIECASIDGNGLVTGRARGLLGGAFMGVMLAQNSGTVDPLFGKCAWVVLVDDSNMSIRTSGQDGTFPAVIDWGDGSTDVLNRSSSLTHTYAKPGKYTVTGTLNAMYVNNSGYSGFSKFLRKVYVGGSGTFGLTTDASYQNNQELQAVDFGNRTVTSIASSVFRDCLSLVSVGSHASCTSIGQFAFENCSSLTSVDFAGVEKVGRGAFKGADAVKKIFLPRCSRLEGWTSTSGLGYSENFASCDNLQELRLGTITYVGGGYVPPLTDGTGEAAPADADGIKLVVRVGNTMESIRRLSAWPWKCIYQTKWVCSDGFITYDSESRTWVNHAT